MSLRFTPYVLPLLMSATICAILAAYTWRRRCVPAATPVAIAFGSVVPWSLAYALELSSTDLAAAIFWANVEYISFVTIPVAWLAATLQYAHRGGWLTPRRLMWLSLIPLMTLALVWTDGFHGLMRREAYLDTSGPFSAIAKGYGPWFWIHTAYSYALLVASLLVLMHALLRTPPAHRGQTVVLIVGMLFPWAGNILRVTGANPIGLFDITPVAFSFSGIAVAWGLLRYHLLDLVPIARDAVIDGMADGVIVLDATDRVVDLNPAAIAVLRRQQTGPVGGDVEEAFRTWPELAVFCKQPETASAELVLSDGEAHSYYEVRISPIYDQRKELAGRVIVLRDVTSHREVDRALREANERLAEWVQELERRNREARTLNEMGDLLQTCLTIEEAHDVVARSAQRLFPGDAGALFVPGASRKSLQAASSWGTVPDQHQAFALEECWALRRNRPHAVNDPGSEPSCSHQGHPVPSGYVCIPMVVHGEVLGVLHLRPDWSVSGDVRVSSPPASESKQRLAVTMSEHVALALANLKLRQTLRDQAIRDPLTGLFNRRYLDETLEREVRRAVRRESCLGVIMLDVDRFKQVNDTMGHAAGDALLAALGQYLQTHVRAEDISCRYGGDEFVLILPEAPLETTQRRAEQLRQEMKLLSAQHQERRVSATVSLGVAAYPEHGLGGAALLRAADSALYRAKAEGRDRVATATPISS